MEWFYGLSPNGRRAVVLLLSPLIPFAVGYLLLRSYYRICKVVVTGQPW